MNKSYLFNPRQYLWKMWAGYCNIWTLLVMCLLHNTQWHIINVSVCPANILVFYFSAIRRDIDLKFIQYMVLSVSEYTYTVVLNSLTHIDLHRSMVKVTGTVYCFLMVQSYHKN